MSANVENSATQIVECSNCHTKNRVPAVAHGVPRCGKCHEPLRWVVNATDADFASVVEAATVPVLVDIWALVRALSDGEPGAGAARWRVCRSDEAGEGQRRRVAGLE